MSEKLKKLDEKNKSYLASLSALAAFAPVVVLIEAIRSASFRADFVELFLVLMNASEVVMEAFISAGEFCAGIGSLIPQPALSWIVHWILQILVTAILTIAAILPISYCLMHACVYIHKNLWDQVTVFALSVISGVVILFADYLAPLLWNLVLIIIISFAAYCGIRSLYIKYKSFTDFEEQKEFVTKCRLAIEVPGIILIIIIFMRISLDAVISLQL